MNKKEKQRRVNLLTSYLTEEEAKEVIPLFKKYYNPLAKDEEDSKEMRPSSILAEAFFWDGTKEGYRFWLKFYNLVLKRHKESTI